MSRLLLTMCYLGGLFLSAAPAEADEADRGLRKVEEPGSVGGAKYRKQWAVIIGINYSDRAAGDKGPGVLRNAERDATAIRDRLVDCYGYQPECIRSLTGKGATKSQIESALYNEFLCHPGEVGDDDSVLVFFSGHGYLGADLTGTKRTGYLFPADVRILDPGVPAMASALPVGAVVDALRDNCKARHKLFVLDSCYSGSVFGVEVGFKGGREVGDAPTAQEFHRKGFQAITAGLETQPVPDGPRGGHSPFTAALLRGLAIIPQRQLGGGAPFTAGELFSTVKADLRAGRSDPQVPVSGWVGSDQGEFHFLPALRPGAAWPKEAELDEDGRKQLLAIIPSTLGHWWADEMPWFMPALRFEMIREKSPARSGDAFFGPEDIRKVAQEVAARKGAGAAGGYRYEHLEMLLKARGLDEQARVIDEVIADLAKRHPVAPAAAATGSPADAALDLHYLAVLYHKRKKTTEADACYRRALTEYKQVCKTMDALLPLRALCCTDYGIFCQTGQNKFDEAARLFEEARAVAGAGAPTPFTVFAMSREADAARRLGLFGVSDDRMKTAKDRMIAHDPTRTRPLTGAVFKHDAWACMEQCRFDAARQSFEVSRAVFEALRAAPNPYPYLIELFHIRHGLAMIERFQGRDEEAVRQFRALTDDIAATIRELDGRIDYLPTYTEVRQLLCERYVNSLDRQGDCRLYGRVPDYAEAADDYRRALRAVGSIPEDRRESLALDLLYRRSIALSLPGGGQNLPLGKLLCEEADRLADHLRTRHGVKGLPGKIVLNRAVAQTLARCPADPCDNALWNLVRPPGYGEPTRPAGDDTRAAFAARSLDRDEVERLMFGCALLLRNKAAWGLSELNALDCCDRLLAAGRRATRPARITGRVDVGFLSYLRPYYDAAFAFKAAQTPPPVKELVEIAWEATRGTGYVKSRTGGPALVYYRTASPQGYLLVDVPATPDQPGLSRCVALGREWNDDGLLREGTKTGGVLPLPGDLREVLAGLKLVRPVDLRWRDPVSGLGLGRTHTAYRLASLSRPMIFGMPMSLAAAAEPVQDKFPFNLSVGGDKRFSEDQELADLGLLSSDVTYAKIPAPGPLGRVPGS
jgi:tetratricopeptide (TPR) repeat protein